MFLLVIRVIFVPTKLIESQEVDSEDFKLNLLCWI